MARNTELEIETRLGKQTIALDRVVTFPKGLIGFEDKREFTLLEIRQGAPMLILQSMDDPSFGLLVADPYSFMQSFSVKISDAEQALLKATDPGQISILVTVSIPAGKPEETSLNLTGPILINHETRLGLQVPQVDPQQPAKVFLAHKAAEAKEVHEMKEAKEVKKAETIKRPSKAKK